MTRLWKCPKCPFTMPRHPAHIQATHRCTPHTRTPVQLTPDPPDDEQRPDAGRRPQRPAITHPTNQSGE